MVKINQKEQPAYIDSFLAFSRIGLTAFGGLAMFAHARKYVVDKSKWMDAITFDSGLALCQVIPGAIIIQLVAFVGLKLKGIRSAAMCFIGFELPDNLFL
jgi:chromate transporter